MTYDDDPPNHFCSACLGFGYLNQCAPDELKNACGSRQILVHGRGRGLLTMGIGAQGTPEDLDKFRGDCVKQSSFLFLVCLFLYCQIIRTRI